MSNRRHQLKAYHRILNTPDGIELMTELESAWLLGNPLDPNIQTMGFNIGLGEAFKQLKAWQAGEGLDADSKLSEIEKVQING